MKRNIANKYLSQFTRQSSRMSEDRHVHYDYGSVMHYGSKVSSYVGTRNHDDGY